MRVLILASLVLSLIGCGGDNDSANNRSHSYTGQLGVAQIGYFLQTQTGTQILLKPQGQAQSTIQQYQNQLVTVYSDQAATTQNIQNNFGQFQQVTVFNVKEIVPGNGFNQGGFNNGQQGNQICGQISATTQNGFDPIYYMNNYVVQPTTQQAANYLSSIQIGYSRSGCANVNQAPSNGVILAVSFN